MFYAIVQVATQKITDMIMAPQIAVILISPAVAVVIGELLRKRNFKKQKRLEILNDLIAYSDKPESIEFLRALNSLKLFFKDEKLKNLLNELRTAFQKRDKEVIDSDVANQLIVKIIKKVCDLERFKNITEEDIKNLFKKKN